MKQDMISIEFQLAGGEPSKLQYQGVGRISNMETCAQLVREFAIERCVGWIICDVQEVDGFAYRIYTTFNDGKTVTDFGVATESYASPKLKACMGEFKALFEINGANSTTLQ